MRFLQKTVPVTLAGCRRWMAAVRAADLQLRSPPMCAPSPAARPRAPPQVLAISRGGLERRGREEGKFLLELEAIAESGVTQAGQGQCVWGGCRVARCGVRGGGVRCVWPWRILPRPLAPTVTSLRWHRPTRAPTPPQADHLLSLYHGPWGGSVDPIYSPEFTY